MTKEEWMELAKKLKRVYQREEKFLPDVDTVNQWYEFLDDLDYERTAKAVKEYIKNEKFAPTVADIRSRHDDLEKAEKTEYYAVKNEFERCRNYYPGSGSIDNGWPEFQERLKKAKEGMQIEAARYLANKVIGYVHECEKNGTDTIDFAECIKTVAV